MYLLLTYLLTYIFIYLLYLPIYRIKNDTEVDKQEVIQVQWDIKLLLT